MLVPKRELYGSRGNTSRRRDTSAPTAFFSDRPFSAVGSSPDLEEAILPVLKRVLCLAVLERPYTSGQRTPRPMANSLELGRLQARRQSRELDGFPRPHRNLLHPLEAARRQPRRCRPPHLCKNLIVKSKEYRGSIVISCDGMSALFKTHESSTFVVMLKNTCAFHMYLEPCTICA